MYANAPFPTCLPEKINAGTWCVLVGGTHVAQQSVRVSIASNEEVLQVRRDLAGAAAARERYLSEKRQLTRVVSGATGTKATMVNGTYEAANEERDGMPVFRKKEDPNMWLCFLKSKKLWIIQRTADQGTNTGWAYVSCDPPSLPEVQLGKWYVFQGDAYVCQPSCLCSLVEF